MDFAKHYFMIKSCSDGRENYREGLSETLFFIPFEVFQEGFYIVANPQIACSRKNAFNSFALF